MNPDIHPPLEILAAFIDGRLDGDRRADVVAHLAVCDACIGLVRGTNEAGREQDASPLPFRPPYWRRPGLLSAAALAIAILGVVGYRFPRPGAQPHGVEALIAASPESYRTIEPRLSGFRWAELRRLRASEGSRPDPEGLKLAGAAGEVLAGARENDSAPAHHSAGVASLLVQDVDRATEELQSAVAQEPNDAHAWNDLAAALYTSAARDRAAAMPRALAAADRALQLDTAYAEARFNRALILERMGLQRETAAAWRDYLAVDPSSPWAAEARRHLAALPAQPHARFGDRIPRLEAAAASGNRTAVEEVLRDFPQETRGWFEADVLGRWGEAELQNDHPSAVKLLDGARIVAAALAAKSGETLLADSIATIDASAVDCIPTLARAHAGYRSGRLAYRDGKLPDAERQFLAAAGAFDAGHSPMSGLARIYAAAVLFDENRIGEAAALVSQPAATAGTHLALRAQAALILGRCDAYACRWSDALRHFNGAERDSRRLGEPSNIAEAQIALGDVYANAGEAAKAWDHRLQAWRIFGAGTGMRLLAALAAAARGELRNEEWASAEALLRLEIGEARSIGDPLLVADAYKRRALLHAQRGEAVAAAADLHDARAEASRAPGSGLRTRFAAECALVEGVSVRGTDPTRSIAAITEAIDFSRAAGDRRLLPEALLERARTYRAAGRPDEAWRDLESGIADVDDRRRTADGGTGATFDAASALFDDAIELLLARGENERAFAVAERAHARALLDLLQETGPAAAPSRNTVAAIAAALPAGGALFEYALLPHRLAIFVVTHDGLRVATRPAARAAIEADVRTLSVRMEERAPVEAIQAIAARLDEALIAPVGALGGNPDSLILVGDRVLESVPWAALWDPQRRQYLVERCALSVAPSAGVWLREQSRLAAGRSGNRLLLITSDQRTDLDPLDELRGEAAALQAAYPENLLLTDAEATPARLLAEAGAADVIHYAGHARAGSETAEAALLLGQSELTAAEISRARLAGPRLVVLAACGTMAEPVRGLEGSLGLARAFLAAGVPTVVGTLWSIRDTDAASLFAAFHRRLQTGSTPPAALRDAQLALLHGASTGAAHPSSWAAAEIVGGTRSTTEKERS